MQALLTIRDIVNEVLLDEYNNSEYLKAAKYVENGISKLMLFHAKTFKSVKLDIDSNRCANLPNDYVRHIVIGVYVNGELIPLTASSTNINIENNCSPDDTEKQYQDTSYRYGHKGGLSPYGEYTINEGKHRIEFSKNITRYDVYLKYIPTGIDNDTLIPVVYKPALVAFAKWKIEKDPRMRVVLKQEYAEELVDLRAATIPTMDELYDAILSGQTPVAKR